MRQMSTVGQIETHQAAVRAEKSRVNGKVSRTAGQRLNVHAPFGRIETISCQSSLLSQYLNLIDNLVASIVTVSTRDDTKQITQNMSTVD